MGFLSRVLGGSVPFRVGGGATLGGLFGGATSDFNTMEGKAGDIAAGALIGAGIGLGTTAAFWKGATGFSPVRARTSRAFGGLLRRATEETLLLDKRRAAAALRPGGIFRRPQAGPIEPADFPLRSWQKNIGLSRLERARANSVAWGDSVAWGEEVLGAVTTQAGRVGAVGAVGYRVARGVALGTAGAVERSPRLVGGSLAIGGGALLMASETSNPVVGEAQEMVGMSRQQPNQQFRNSAAGVVQGLHRSRHGGY